MTEINQDIEHLNRTIRELGLQLAEMHVAVARTEAHKQMLEAEVRNLQSLIVAKIEEQADNSGTEAKRAKSRKGDNT